MSGNLTLKNFGLKTTAFPWIILGLVYLIIDFVITGMSRAEFPYGLLYAFSFISVAMILGAKRVSLIGGLMTALVGTLTVFAQMNLSFDIWWLTGLGVAGFAIVMLDILGVLKWGNQAGVKYLTFVPFFLTAAWTILYFYQRYTTNLPLPIATILNHGGLALLSIDGIIRVGGKGTKKSWLTFAALIVTVMGALWLTYGLGWGLRLI